MNLDDSFKIHRLVLSAALAAQSELDCTVLTHKGVCRPVQAGPIARLAALLAARRYTRCSTDLMKEFR